MIAHRCNVFHLIMILALLKTGHAKVGIVRPRAEAPGHIIIGGLFPIHDDVEDDNSNSEPGLHQGVGFDESSFTKALAMINAIETVNKMPMLTNLGITLGYRIYDTRSDVSTALRATADMTQQGDCTSWTNTSSSQHSVMAVIGPRASEISIAVARQLNLNLIPQISYASTASILSDKTRFPAFMRTVPSDLYQTRAMVRLLSDNNWNWVGVITTDGDYGRSALDNFVSQASSQKICVAFQEVIPDSIPSTKVSQSALQQAAETIYRNPKVKVVLSFLKPAHMKYLFQVLKELEPVSRVWVASDSWSTSTDVLGELKLEDIGDVVGFTFKKGNTTSFDNYLMKLESNSTPWSPLFTELYPNWNTSSSTKVIEMIRNSSNSESIFSVELAVSAISEFVANICKTKNCTSPGSIQPWEVLNALRSMQPFHSDNLYRFDSNGDINLGYDVVLWGSAGEAMQKVVAEYNPLTQNFNFTSHHAMKHLQEIRNVVSRCSETCQPGQSKKTAEGQHTCCYECINCTENYYSNNTDMDQCLSCNRTREWSPAGSSKCIAKTLEYFSWQDGFAIVLLTFAALGILLVFLVGALFLWKRNTPVVKAAGGPLSQLILFSLVCSFVSALLFVGHSSELQCKARQVLFGLSFTLCVSCILVKSLRILTAFQFNPWTQERLRRLYKPYPIVSGCVGVQVLICTLWLVLYSPQEKLTVFVTFLLAECYEGSYVFFGVMLGYIAVLALVCFVCAFKGRKLPQKYNEAKFITFGMLLYLISWVIFVPVYVTTTGKYLPAVEMVVILISCYGILCCQFFPKCYIILFRKEHNTISAFKQNLYEYSCKNTSSTSVSKPPLSENKTSCRSHIISSPPIVFPPLTEPTTSRKPSVLRNGSATQIFTNGDMLTGQPRRLRRTSSM